MLLLLLLLCGKQKPEQVHKHVLFFRAGRGTVQAVIEAALVQNPSGRGYQLNPMWMSSPVFKESHFRREEKSMASDQLGRT